LSKFHPNKDVCFHKNMKLETGAALLPNMCPTIMWLCQCSFYL